MCVLNAGSSDSSVSIPGYNCITCSQWVPAGNTHTCPNTTAGASGFEYLGYTCVTCYQWVPVGTSHACGMAPGYPGYLAAINPMFNLMWPYAGALSCGCKTKLVVTEQCEMHAEYEAENPEETELKKLHSCPPESEGEANVNESA